MFCLGSIEEINKDNFLLSCIHCSGDKYYCPSPEEKYTVLEGEIMCRIYEMRQFLCVFPLFQIYDGILIKMFNS